MKNKRIFPLFMITLGYFALGLINMTAAMTMLICMGLPFLLVIRNRQKSWCKGMCPRADFFNLFKKFGLNRKSPAWLKGKRIKAGILIYFGVSILFITLSTVMVILGKRNPMESLRFMIVFNIPFNIPQLITLSMVPDALIHLSYRFYSLMMTSTVLGTLLAFFFKPRTWCAICPVNQLTGSLLKGMKNKEQNRVEKSFRKAG